jgi:hypothetical protein
MRPGRFLFDSLEVSIVYERGFCLSFGYRFARNSQITRSGLIVKPHSERLVMYIGGGLGLLLVIIILILIFR